MAETEDTKTGTVDAYCAELIRTEDEDLALTLPYVRDGDRSRVAALYALALELRKIPAAVSEPGLGEIRLQWWRDALDELLRGDKGRAHPVIQALSRSGAVTGVMRDQAEIGIDARARLLYKEPFLSLEELSSFLTDAEGWLAVAVLEVTGSDAAKIKKAAGRYALSRWRLALAPGLDGHAPGPLKALAPTPADVAPILYLGLTNGYQRREPGALWPLGKRLRLFICMATGRL